MLSNGTDAFKRHSKINGYGKYMRILNATLKTDVEYKESAKVVTHIAPFIRFHQIPIEYMWNYCIEINIYKCLLKQSFITVTN